MNVWVCRTGKSGEYEERFLQNKRIFLTRDNLDLNLKSSKKDEIIDKLYECDPSAKRQTISNTWSQIDIFSNRMEIGDIVLIPKKNSSLLHVAKIIGDYVYDSSKDDVSKHFREIHIIQAGVDTHGLPQNLLYSLGAFRTIFSIRQKEELLAELKKKGVPIDEI